MIGFKQFLLLEATRLEFLTNQYKGIDTSHDEFAHVSGTANIVNHFATYGDPTPNKAYTGWLMNQYKNKKIYQNDVPEYKRKLGDFHQFKHKLDSKDINSYADFSEMEAAVKPHKDAELKRLAAASAKPIHDDGENQIYHLTNKEHSQNVYGGGSDIGGNHTNWCTAARSHDCAFDSYAQNGDLYTLHTNHKDSPHQLYIPNGQVPTVMSFELNDRHNKTIEPSNYIQSVPKLAPVLAKMHPSFDAEGVYLDTHLKSNNAKIRSAAVKHPNLSSDQLHAALTDKDINVVTAASKHNNITSDHLNLLLTHHNNVIRAQVAKHPLVTDHHLSTLANDPDEGVRLTIADRTSIPKDAVHKLVHDSSYSVMHKILSNVFVSAKVTSKDLHDVIDTHGLLHGRNSAILNHPSADDSHAERYLTDTVKINSAAGHNHMHDSTFNIFSMLNPHKFDTAKHLQYILDNHKHFNAFNDMSYAFDSVSDEKRLTSKHIESALKPDVDLSIKLKAVKSNVITDEQLSHVISGAEVPSNATLSLGLEALMNNNIKAHHLTDAINTGESRLARSALHHPDASADHARQALAKFPDSDKFRNIHARANMILDRENT